MASTPSPTTIPDWVPGEQLSYKGTITLQLKESDNMKETCNTLWTEVDAIQHKHLWFQRARDSLNLSSMNNIR